jgi:HEAT repeat protein
MNGSLRTCAIIALMCLIIQSATPAQTGTGAKSTGQKKADETPAKTESDKSASKESAETRKKKQEDFEKKADLKKFEWIEKTMDYGIQKDRKDAIGFIPTVQDPGKKRLLEEKLVKCMERESDSSVLVKSINVSKELKLSPAIGAIRKLLSHESGDVQLAAVYALNDMKATASKGDLVEMLKKRDFTKDSNLTEAIIQTLADFGSFELKDFIIEKIKDNKTTRNLRLKCILFLGKSGAAESKEYLIKAYKDPDEEIDIRSYCVNSIAQLGFKDAVPDINKFVDEYNTYTFNKKKDYNTLYLYSISALVKLGDDSAFPRLLDSLKSDSTTTRLRAIQLLKGLKDKRSIDILTYKMQYDPSAKVQKAAREVLKDMGIDVSKDEPRKAESKKNDPGKKIDTVDDETSSDDKSESLNDF